MFDIVLFVVKRAKHKVLCQAIKGISERESLKEKGLGDAQDRGVYATHITPSQQERIVKLVGWKCVVDCYLYDKPTEVLWAQEPKYQLFQKIS